MFFDLQIFGAEYLSRLVVDVKRLACGVASANIYGLSFDPFTLLHESLLLVEIGVGKSHLVYALMGALVIVMSDEHFDLALKIAW